MNPSLCAQQEERIRNTGTLVDRRRRAYFREAKRRSRAETRKRDPAYDRYIRGLDGAR